MGEHKKRYIMHRCISCSNYSFTGNGLICSVDKDMQKKLNRKKDFNCKSYKKI